MPIQFSRVPKVLVRFRRALRSRARRIDALRAQLALPGSAHQRVAIMRQIVELGRPPAPPIAGADTMTRQRRRAQLRDAAYRLQALSSPAPRAERRRLARALAAFRWRHLSA